MHFALPVAWILLALLPSAAYGEEPTCELGTWTVELYAWAIRNDSFVRSDTVTLTATIVTVINTVIGSTGTITKFPPSYTPPTNEGGTRVETLSYTRWGTAYTTIV
jgi:hypothetical protein